jgi:DHA1 family bicyclomycin/chloramphenicol resistance-like MFS transporter
VNKKASRALIAQLMLLVCLPRVAIDIYLPSLPSMIVDLASNSQTLQLTLSLYMVGYALSMLICGPFSDRYGRRLVLLVGIGIYLLATLVCMLSTSAAVIIVARILQAFGGAAGTVIGRVMVRDEYERLEQTRILTYLSTAMALSPVVAPVLGGVIETYAGWRGNFASLAAYVRAQSRLRGGLVHRAADDVHHGQRRRAGAGVPGRCHATLCEGSGDGVWLVFLPTDDHRSGLRWGGRGPS